MSCSSAIDTVPANLRERLDNAVELGETGAIVSAVTVVLEELISADAVNIPEELCEPKREGYARRLLYYNSDLDYSVLVMAWGLGQGTPLHDHAGLWCVEGVWRGQLDVVQYDLIEQKGGYYRFDPQRAIAAGTGSAGSLIPPNEYHTIANALEDKTAVTLHVYGGLLERCSIFVPDDDGWYRKESRALGFD